ncbi:hypothetical protein [Prosthecobacter debontii]|nr:hypothetical protein [Prosthecobacter debontii]
MRLTQFALALTIILLAITGYLAWEGQQAAKGAREELAFVKKQQAADRAASPEASSLVPLPSVPATSVTPPPEPGTIAKKEADPELAEVMAGAGALPGGGLTVPKSVIQAESQGISTNTLTPMQKQVLAIPAVAKVKTVVKEQGFVVLDAGSKAGLTKGQQLEVRRDSAILGKITVTDSIEETEAVADLDFASIPTGVSIEPGDEVIAPVSR